MKAKICVVISTYNEDITKELYNSAKKELKNQKNVGFLHNKDFFRKEMLHSFYLALKKFNTDLLFCYSDIIFSKKIVAKIIQSRQKKIVLPIKSNWKKIWKIRNFYLRN